MNTTHRISGRPSVCLFLCGFLLTGCLSPKHLQPVANQNRANIEALSQNALTCLALYETQFSASVESLLILRISGINSSLIGAVGPPQLSPGTAPGWESLLANKPAYAHRWQEVRAALAQNPDESVKRQLRARHGWIYQTVADPDFTPQRAHRMVIDLDDLQKRFGAPTDRKEFIRRGENILRGYDLTLEMYREQIDAASMILAQLRIEMSRQINFADSHSRSILAFSQSEVDVGETISGILSSSELSEVINTVGAKLIKDDALRKSAVDLLAGIPSTFSP